MDRLATASLIVLFNCRNLAVEQGTTDLRQTDLDARPNA
jgi:hypothetical protein